MKMLAALITALSLPATATEDDALAAVAAQGGELSAMRDRLQIAEAAAGNVKERLAALEGERIEREKLARSATIDAGITSLIAAGKIRPGSETEAALRRTGERDVDVFSASVKDMLATGPTVTPVGAPIPANSGDPKPEALTGSKGYLAAKPEAAKWLAKAGITEADFEKHGADGREIAGLMFQGS